MKTTEKIFSYIFCALITLIMIVIDASFIKHLIINFSQLKINEYIGLIFIISLLNLLIIFLWYVIYQIEKDEIKIKNGDIVLYEYNNGIYYGESKFIVIKKLKIEPKKYLIESLDDKKLRKQVYFRDIKKIEKTKKNNN